MALAYDGAIQNLIDAFAQLPGIGPKGAQRIAFYLLGADEQEVQNLAEAILEIKAKVRFCDICGNVCETSPCPICADPRRDHGVICVVQEPKDVMIIERTREYRGLYHVLGGVINPMSNIGPADLRIPQLLKRLDGALPTSTTGVYSGGAGETANQTAEAQNAASVAQDTLVPSGSLSDADQQDTTVREIILALNPNIEGDATTRYLAQLLGPLGITITRLASGLPVGSDLEYADEITLGRALAGRRQA